MLDKLGLQHASDRDDAEFDALLALFEAEGLDYTGAFRTLAESLRRDDVEVFPEDNELGADWLRRWRERLVDEGRPLGQVADAMDAVNPIYIPRNHLVEEALAAATDGDVQPFEQLLDVVTHPFVERAGLERFAQPAPDSFQRGYRTFCGT